VRALWRATALVVLCLDLAALGGASAQIGANKFYFGKPSFSAVEPIPSGFGVSKLACYSYVPWCAVSRYIIPYAGHYCGATLAVPNLSIWASQLIFEFDSGRGYGPLLAEIFFWEKYFSESSRMGNWTMDNGHFPDILIGSGKISVKPQIIIHPSSWGSPYILHKNAYFYLDFISTKDDWSPFWDAQFDSHPWPVRGNQGFSIDSVRLCGGTGMRIGSIGSGLSGSYSFPSFGSGTISHVNTLLKKEALQQPYDDKTSCCIDQPLGKRGKISRINRELAIVFGNLPFGIYIFFGLIGGGILWCSFIILETGRVVAGSFAFALGLAVLLSNGFAVIGSGPLGWIAWINWRLANSVKPPKQSPARS
jgi:hypothetical protein